MNRAFSLPVYYLTGTVMFSATLTFEDMPFKIRASDLVGPLECVVLT